MPSVGISLVPVGSGPGAEAQGAEGSLFWANSWGVDSDVIATPLPAGVQVLGQLRSADSPENFQLRLDLPTGARARLEDLGRGPARGVVIERGGELLATVSPPVVFDADGVTVPATYALEDDVIDIRVEHRGRDVRYPLVLDPIVEDQQHWHTNGGMDFTGWVSGTVPAGTPYNNGSGDWWMGRGLWTFDADAVYNNGSYGYWRFNSPGTESFIYATQFHYVRTHPQDTCLTEAIYSGSAGYQSQLQWCNQWLNYEGHQHCVWWGCAETAGAPDNTAYFMTIAAYYNSYRDTFANYFGGAVVWLNDLTAPVESTPIHSQLPTGWVDGTTATVRLRGHDNGLGLKQFLLRVPGYPDRVRTHNCAGHRNDRCPISSSTNTYSDNARVGGDSFTYPTSDIPDGIQTINGFVADLTGNWSAPQSWQIKVDHDPPSQPDLQGALKTYENRVVPPGVHDLRVTAYDGNAQVPASGMKRIEIYVCSETPGDCRMEFTTLDQSCATDSCTQETTWNFVTSLYQVSPGRKTIQVHSYDQLNHRSIEKFDVIVAPLA